MATIPEALTIAVQQIQSGRLPEAEQILRQILQVDPNHVDAMQHLGRMAFQLGKPGIAAEFFERSVVLRGDIADFHNNLGVALLALRRLPEAEACFRRALELRPIYAEAQSNLGNALNDLGRPEEAAACCRAALALLPNFPEACNNLGNALKDLGKLDEAVASYRRALELRPDFGEACNNLGNALKDRGKLDEAAACFRRVLELMPHLAGAYSNLGLVLKDQGKLDEAIACFRRALELIPDLAEAQSNLLYSALFCPGVDAATIFEEHREWNERFAAQLARFALPHANDRSPERRLRIGYVSADFRDHVIGRNLLPLYREHDHQQFEIFSYADLRQRDGITEIFLAQSDAWCSTAGLTDEQFAERIRADRIDILVDLTLHMARNRLAVFARKPAPVQVTFAGYPGTTGLSTIDYRLTDPHIDPPGLFDRFYSEESVRLPESFWCYDSFAEQPPCNDLPALKNGYVTFGCLNNFCKVNPSVLKLWARVLKAVDRSQLLLLTCEGSHRQETRDRLAGQGITPDRVHFAPEQPRPKYLETYHRIDIALDTLPYNGHTTSLDAFSMGVPVVTLVGSTVVGRAGVCQLMNLGLPELIAQSEEDYIRIAAELASDLPRLSGLRATLRDRLAASPLMDAPRFARGIEAAYRAMWRRWCEK